MASEFSGAPAGPETPRASGAARGFRGPGALAFCGRFPGHPRSFGTGASRGIPNIPGASARGPPGLLGPPGDLEPGAPGDVSQGSADWHWGPASLDSPPRISCRIPAASPTWRRSGSSATSSLG
eukprot:4317756-Pyramimonas_sp.AAC.1